MNRRMYIEPSGGLCNRIGVFNYGIKLAQKYGYEPILLWKNNGEIACNYEDVFRDIDSLKVKNLYYPQESPKALLKQGRIFGVIRWILLTGKCEIYRRNLLRHELEMYDGTDMPRVEANRINEEKIANATDKWIIVSTYRCAEMDYDYSEIKFIDKYYEIVKQIIGEDTTHIVGVHIRRTDHRFAIDANPIANFIAKMKKIIEIDSEAKFYIASDDGSVIDQLRKEFPDRVIVNEGAVLTRKSKVGIENAVIDLLALSKSSRIIGSKGSTFSDIASFIGLNPLEYASDID